MGMDQGRQRGRARAHARPHTRAGSLSLHSTHDPARLSPAPPTTAHRRVCCSRGGCSAASAQHRRLRQKEAMTDEELAAGMKVPPLAKSDFTEKELAEKVFLNCVGTFGVASAGYWWGRAGACIMRLAHCLMDHKHAIRSLLYSDDGAHREVRALRGRPLVLPLRHCKLPKRITFFCKDFAILTFLVQHVFLRAHFR